MVRIIYCASHLKIEDVLFKKSEMHFLFFIPPPPPPLKTSGLNCLATESKFFILTERCCLKKEYEIQNL